MRSELGPVGFGASAMVRSGCFGLPACVWIGASLSGKELSVEFERVAMSVAGRAPDLRNHKNAQASATTINTAPAGSQSFECPFEGILKSYLSPASESI
jgi:hypothetical protein